MRSKIAKKIDNLIPDSFVSKRGDKRKNKKRAWMKLNTIQRSKISTILRKIEKDSQKKLMKLKCPCPKCNKVTENE